MKLRQRSGMRFDFPEMLGCGVGALWICAITVLFMLEHSNLIAYFVEHLIRLLSL